MQNDPSVKVRASVVLSGLIMAILLKVQWVDQVDPSGQSGPHARIAHIGGVSGRLAWKHSQSQAIESIEHKLFDYYVEKDARAMKLNVAQTADGKKFLIANGGNEQQLLSLPAFPSANPSRR
jgi:hypothetical protein